MPYYYYFDCSVHTLNIILKMLTFINATLGKSVTLRYSSTVTVLDKAISYEAWAKVQLFFFKLSFILEKNEEKYSVTFYTYSYTYIRHAI